MESFPGKFDRHCAKLVQEGKWELVHEHINAHYYMNYHGLVQVYRKTLSVPTQMVNLSKAAQVPKFHQRETDRQTDRDRDRQTDRGRDRDGERQWQTETEKQSKLKGIW